MKRIRSNRCSIAAEQQHLLVNEKANRLRRLESQCARYSQIDSSTSRGRFSTGEDDVDVIAVAMAQQIAHKAAGAAAINLVAIVE